MHENFADIVYDLVTGQRIAQPGDPEIEDLFATGRDCAKLYEQVYNANLHLCQRLNAGESDEDVETIIDSLLKICAQIGKRMYLYGATFGHK